MTTWSRLLSWPRRLVGGVGIGVASLSACAYMRTPVDDEGVDRGRGGRRHLPSCAPITTALCERHEGGTDTPQMGSDGKTGAPPRYVPVPLHFKVPHGIFLHEATSVAVDSHDRVFVFNRGNMPVVVFDQDGNCIGHWCVHAFPCTGHWCVRVFLCTGHWCVRAFPCTGHWCVRVFLCTDHWCVRAFPCTGHWYSNAL